MRSFAEAMHAWVEVFRPEFGWVGMDATAGAYADDRYVVVGYGRDYDDVRPIRGVIRVATAQSNFTRLQMELAAIALDCGGSGPQSLLPEGVPHAYRRNRPWPDRCFEARCHAQPRACARWDGRRYRTTTRGATTWRPPASNPFGSLSEAKAGGVDSIIDLTTPDLDAMSNSCATSRRLPG